MQNLPLLFVGEVGKVKVTKFENETCCTGNSKGKTGNCNKFQAKKKMRKILENAHKLSIKCCQVQLCSELELELRQLVSFMPLEANAHPT